MIFMATIWGASFVFIKKSVAIFTPVQAAMWRMAGATVLYMPIAVMYWSKIDWKRWKPLVIVAFCGSAIPNLFFAVAQQHVDSSLAGMLNSLTPLFTLLIGATVYGMRVSGNKILGVMIGFSGAVVLVLFNGNGGVSGNAFFAGLCVLATVCYAINANTVNQYLRDSPPAAIASAAFMLTGSLFFFGLWVSGGWDAAWQHPQGMKGLGYIFYLSAVGTVLGSILYFWLLQRTSAIFATSVTYLLPIGAIAIGALDGEQIGWIDMLGTAIILLGVYLARK
jgi:drug/metabolite transporter (DMT)-like permease